VLDSISAQDGCCLVRSWRKELTFLKLKLIIRNM